MLHYACCLEDHQDGGKHYLFRTKLSLPKQWGASRQYLQLNYGIDVNIQQIKLGDFIYAYRYVCKTGANVHQRSGHLPLEKL